ncbi:MULTISPECIES: AtpZ/AtpI family protein [Embleya]|jgi:ATP synthase protein I|uniref:AtpZ/AtpI family protein n=1 Tax=Embleya TaxID=2699295 RepID=UPI00036E4A7A|nr:AtpZ/AtpI family protein [Embleya scabrispora]
MDGAAWSSVGYLLSGMLFYGGIGWLIDRWTGHSALFLPIGLVVGIALSLVLVFVRHGRSS